MSWEGIVGIIGIFGSVCAIVAFFISRRNAAKEDGAREEKQRVSETQIKDHESRIRDIETKIVTGDDKVKRELEAKIAAVEEKEAANYKELQASEVETQRLISNLSGIMERLVIEVGDIRRDLQGHITRGD